MAESLRDKLRRLRREDAPGRAAGEEVAAGPSTELGARAAEPGTELRPSDSVAQRIEHAPTSSSAPSGSAKRDAEALNSSATSRALANGLARRGERLAKHVERRAEARAAHTTNANTHHGERAPAPAAFAAHTDVATTTGSPDGLERCSRSNVAARCTPLAREHAHGAWRLDAALAADAKTLALLAKDEALAGLDLRDALFLDTETTGLSGGAGTYVFLVGLGSFTTDGFEVWQGFLGDPSEERGLLAETAERIARAPLLVTFFGKSFDRHRLEDKMRLHGVTPPFAKKPHLDLYHPLRRLYGKALPDTRLKTMEHALCGVRRANDLPGAFAPAAWFDFLAARPHRLEGVFAHNHDDVLSLVTLAAHAGRTSEQVPVRPYVLAHEPALRALGLARLLAERRDFSAAFSRLESLVLAGAPSPGPMGEELQRAAIDLLIRLDRLPEARSMVDRSVLPIVTPRDARLVLALLIAEARSGAVESRRGELSAIETVTSRSAIGADHADLRRGLRILARLIASN